MARWVGVGTQQPRAGVEPMTSWSQSPASYHSTTAYQVTKPGQFGSGEFCVVCFFCIVFSSCIVYNLYLSSVMYFQQKPTWMALTNWCAIIYILTHSPSSGWSLLTTLCFHQRSNLTDSRFSTVLAIYHIFRRRKSCSSRFLQYWYQQAKSLSAISPKNKK